ncbi:ABC transporter ATP-binding protein [Saliphagus sp. GCM10025317]
MTVRDGVTTSPNSWGRETLIEVRNASVTFDMERGTSKVMDDVTMDIHRNEILGIVGESGSGKSMFASALLDAVVNPGRLTGEVIYHPPDGDPFDVRDLDEEELRKFRWEEVSMVFQGAMDSFNPTMSIGGHFKETLRAHNRDVEEGMAYGRELLTDLYLDPERVLDSYPHELSGGMQQRALIALSLLLEPSVLVMDEPTAALDLLMQRSITNLLAKLHDEYEITMIFITHDLPLVADLADRLAVMYAFQFVEVGPCYDILKDAAHPYTRALLKAVPNLSSALEDMQPIEGDSPDPVNVPKGCSYHIRCPLADEQCVAVDPELEPVSADHEVACYHWEDAREQLTYTLSDQEQEVTFDEP